MTKSFAPFVLLLLISLLIVRLLNGQEVQPPVVNSTGTMPSATPLPSSVRYMQPRAWFTDQHPGVEGCFGFPTDDPNHIFTWHLNHWRAITTNTTIQ